jgi:hypothetical protein
MSLGPNELCEDGCAISLTTADFQNAAPRLDPPDVDNLQAVLDLTSLYIKTCLSWGKEGMLCDALSTRGRDWGEVGCGHCSCKVIVAPLNAAPFGRNKQSEMLGTTV